MLTSLRAVATHRPGLYILTAMAVVPAIVCRTPAAIGSGIVSLLILAVFLAFPDRLARPASEERALPVDAERSLS
jgi:hypothetical protein